MKRFRAIEHYISYRMAKMNHGEAIRLGATEKYVLGELPQSLRDEFEEHYFECLECALDLKAAAGFVDNARAVLRQNTDKSAVKVSKPARGRSAWFRSVIVVPAFATLLLILAYQNTVTIPKLKEEAGRGGGHLFTSSFSLQMANTHGSNEVKVPVHRNESFGLDFDFIPAHIYDKYVCQLQDQSGRSFLQQSIPGTSANTEQHLVILGGLIHPGKYHLVFVGGSGTKVHETEDEVLRLSFSVEFLE